jgi:hypothetical protein
MEMRYCLEEEVYTLIAEYMEMAKKQKMNINIVPQFVGCNPCVCAYGPSSTYYKTIILSKLPKEVAPQTLSSFNANANANANDNENKNDICSVTKNSNMLSSEGLLYDPTYPTTYKS